VVADTAPARMRGLLGRDGLEEGEGLLIRPTNSVHMFFMRFAIDVVFVDRELAVRKIVERLRPWRMAGCRGARAALELPAGAASRYGITVGEQRSPHSRTASASCSPARMTALPHGSATTSSIRTPRARSWPRRFTAPTAAAPCGSRARRAVNGRRPVAGPSESCG